MLKNDELKFLNKRKRLINTWRLVGPLSLVLILGFLLWFYVRYPLLVNPFEVVSRLESGTLETSTLSLMAVMLPIMFLVCFGLLITIVLLMFVAFSNEKKYLEILSNFKKD